VKNRIRTGLTKLRDLLTADQDLLASMAVNA
jgi:hypothetical protein